MTMDLWTYEREQWAAGHETVCGVDEAGAGPLAGPVYAAAVILPRELDIPGLNDSKKLTERSGRPCTNSSPPRRRHTAWPPSPQRRSTRWIF